MNVSDPQEEKKYFQRELVNRETNFNKVFNACPQVGILNPLATKVTLFDFLCHKFQIVNYANLLYKRSFIVLLDTL